MATAERFLDPQVLYEIIETVTSSLALEDILNSTVRLVSRATRCDACFLYLWDSQKRKLVLRGATPGYEAAIGEVCLDLGEGVAGWAALTHKPVIIPRGATRDPRFKRVPQIPEAFESMISVPVVSRMGRLVGALNVYSRGEREFTVDDLNLVSHTASLIAGALENTELFEALRAKERTLEELVRKTIEAQEEERRRVAGEIHDGVTQQLIGAWYQLQALEALIETDPQGARETLQAARMRIEEALEEARAAIYNLRPSALDDLGLAPALRTLAARVAEESGMQIQVHAEEIRLPAHVETAIYRIVQEALTNVRKHSGARLARVRVVKVKEGVEVAVADDGRGFDPSEAEKSTSFGIKGMRERAEMLGGSLTLTSLPGVGTEVRILVPLATARSAPERRGEPLPSQPRRSRRP